MIEDIDELKGIVAGLKGTTQDLWVPPWRETGLRHEQAGDRFEAEGDHPRARKEYLLAKTYYAIGRFPGEITSVKAGISGDCARAYRKACAHIAPPLEVVDVTLEGRTIRTHSGRRSPMGRCPPP